MSRAMANPSVYRPACSRFLAPNVRLRTRAAAVFRLLVLATLPFSALADTAAQEPLLSTKDEYLACLKAQSSIQARKASLQDRDLKLKEKAAKFQSAEADLNAQVKKHPPATNKEIESYNKAIASRNASVASLNKESMSLQQELATLNKQIVENNSTCGSMLVSPEDAQAAEEEHRKGSGAK